MRAPWRARLLVMTMTLSLVFAARIPAAYLLWREHELSAHRRRTFEPGDRSNFSDSA